jgi:gamma-glutamyltranspeptidase/glutathione hydrolase
VRTAVFSSRFAGSGMVCAVDHLAAEAGVETMRRGGNAVDAAIATNAVLAVTTQQMCGMGGDLFALVHVPGEGRPLALNASGRAGSGADPDRMRAEGHRHMPLFGDIRSVPVPGCVDGWCALHERLGRLPLREVLEPARRYAADGFPAAPTLARSAPSISSLPGAEDFRAATEPGAIVRRPGAARMLDAIGSEGRDGFYLGEFGKGLLSIGAGEYGEDDLSQPLANWVEPLHVSAWGAGLWTIPPNSQGYLTLASAWIADGLSLPDDPDDPLWAHLLVEAARAASYDRVAALHENADGNELVSAERLASRRARISGNRAAQWPDEVYAGGGTIYMCTTDADRMGVSLIQSNAAGFGAQIFEPSTGISLQNRGIGFSLEPGHPAEYAAGRRPPHTLSPALVTKTSGELDMVIGSMGGDAQPQIVLQLLARILRGGESIGDTIAAPRWVLAGAPPAGNGFDTWDAQGPVQVHIEAEAPAAWESGLRERGHDVVRHPPLGYNVGHAHCIANRGEWLEGASDPRSLAGSASGY